MDDPTLDETRRMVSHATDRYSMIQKNLEYFA